MILKYYFNILVYPFVILLLSVSTSIYSHNYKQLFYSSIRIGLILFLLNLVINYFIFNPVSQFLKNEKTSPKLNKRILNLSIYSTISFFLISILYIVVHLYLMGKEYENVFTLEIIMRLINRYTILGTIFTYFIIDNYTISLKEYIYYKNGLALPNQRVKIWQKLFLTYVIISFSPLFELYFLITPYLKADNEVVYTQIIVIFTTLVILIISSMYFISRGFRKPVYLLLNTFNKVKEGIYITAPIVSSDEMGVLTSNFNKMVQGLKEREYIKDTFGKFVTEEIAQEILKGNIKLSGTTKVITILFTDIANYTTITENLEPVETVNILNSYFSEIVEIVKQNKGVVNKFIGDAVMAIFGAPIDDENHVANAIKCGLEIQSREFIYDGVVLKTRVGINTDKVLVGNIGTANRMEYTVIGDGVNVASRLETLNKKYNTTLLIGENSYEMTKDLFQFEEMGRELLKGKTNFVKVYKIIV